MKKKLMIMMICIFSLAVMITNVEANMFNKFKKGFYFEKYKTSEEAKEVLLKLHPIGSSIDELVKTLEKAGAWKSMNRSEVVRFESQLLPFNEVDVFYFKHRTINSLYPKSWSVFINLGKNNNIIKIWIQIYQGE